MTQPRGAGKRYTKTLIETKEIGEALIRRHEEAVLRLRGQMLQLNFYANLLTPTVNDREMLDRLRYDVQSGDWRQR